MNQSDHVLIVTAITVCDVIRKIVTKMDFLYQTDLYFFLSKSKPAFSKENILLSYTINF